MATYPPKLLSPITRAIETPIKGQNQRRIQHPNCLPLRTSPPAAEPTHARATGTVGKTPMAAKRVPKYDTPGDD